MYSDRPRRIDRLLAFADCWRARPYIVQGERTVTFGGCGARAPQRRGSSSRSGRTRRTGIAVRLDSPDWILNFWACVRIGAIPVLGNAWWSEGELEHALNLLRPVLALADAPGAAKLPSNCRRAPWGVDEGSAGVPPADPHGAAPASFDENAPAVIIFTSGTAGRAKAVVLAHRGLLATLQMLLHVTRRLPYRTDAAAGEVCLHTGPLFHIGGVGALLRGVTVGNTLVLPRDRFDPAEARQLIERYEVSCWNAVPTMATRLLDHPDMGRRHLRSLRALTLGGAPVHAELLQRVRAVLPDVEARIATGYGLSENGGQATAASGADTSLRPGTSGRPLPCVELDIASRPGLPDGEIRVRSPTQMLGYFGDDGSRSMATDGSAPAISDASTMRGTFGSSGVARTSSSGAARTSRRLRSNARWWRYRGSATRRCSAFRTPISARKSRPSSWLWPSLRASGSKSSCAQAWHHLRCRAAGGSRLSRSRSTKRARSTRRHCLPDCERSAGARPRRRRHEVR